MLILSVLGFFVVIFLLATITVAIAWMGFVKRTAEANDARRSHDADGSVLVEDSRLFRSDLLSTLSFWQNILTRFDFVEILKVRLEQAELNWSVGRVTLTMLLSGTIAGLLVRGLLPVWAALLVAGGVAYIPYACILNRRAKRFLKFREMFPDVLESLARALRAGYPVSAAFETVANEVEEPIATEMRRVSVEANLGMGWQRALQNLGERMPLLEVNLFSSAVTLHARTGGRLSEVMADLAGNMRESLALQGEVRALSAHGKLTGMILTILPIGIAGMMMIVSPNYMFVLYYHPWGKTLIAAAIGCLVLAHFVIRKLVDIKI
ncbi:MAG: type II secretion system F family protein [Acidobacteriota bacterium]